MSQKYVKCKTSYNILLNYNCIWLSILGCWVNLIKIQSFLPQQFPISISSSKTSLASGGIEKSASNSTISNTIKSKATSLADYNLNSTCTTSQYKDDEVSASEENEVETIEVKTKVGTNEDIRLKFGPQQNTNDQNFHHYRSNNVSSHKNLKGK